MSNGSAEKERPGVVAWSQLPRVNTHRTSRPTNVTLRRLVAEISIDRGSKVAADTVIMAALQVASRDMNRFADAIREVETERYTVHDGPGGAIEPGE